MQKGFLDTYRFDSKVLTPEAFVSLSEEERKEFSDTEIIPPSLDSDSFGYIRVKLKTPEYVVDFEK